MFYSCIRTLVLVCSFGAGHGYKFLNIVICFSSDFYSRQSESFIRKGKSCDCLYFIPICFYILFVPNNFGPFLSVVYITIPAYTHSLGLFHHGEVNLKSKDFLLDN